MTIFEVISKNGGWIADFFDGVFGVLAESNVDNFYIRYCSRCLRGKIHKDRFITALNKAILNTSDEKIVECINTTIKALDSAPGKWFWIDNTNYYHSCSMEQEIFELRCVV